MAQTIRLKRRAAGGTAGAPASLVASEPAYNEVDDILYYGKGNNAGNAQTVIPIAGQGAFLSLTATQMISGAKTMIGTWDATGGTTTVATPAGTDNTQKAANTAWVRGYAQPLDADLSAIAALSGVGGTPFRIAANTWALRSLGGTADRIAVTNGDGVAGAPVIDLAALTIGGSGVGSFTKFTVDTYGRVTATAQANHSEIGAPTAAVSWGSQRLTDLAEPVNPQDAATKNYVDLARQGIDAKASVRVASTVNVNIASPGTTIDGVTMANGDRVLLTGQTTASQNGIYVFNGSAAAMTRATDADTNAKVTAGMFTFTEEGTNADKGWVLATDGAVTLGTTALNFTIFNTAGATYTFNNGIANTSGTVGLTGQALAFHQAATGIPAVTASGVVASRTITGTANRVSVANGSGVGGNPAIDIDAGYIGQTSITTLGVIGTGTWQGTVVGVAYGGTGAADAPTARTNLGLGSIATQNANNVNITGGTISGVALDNVIIDGGTF